MVEGIGEMLAERKGDTIYYEHVLAIGIHFLDSQHDD